MGKYFNSSMDTKLKVVVTTCWVLIILAFAGLIVVKSKAILGYEAIRIISHAVSSETGDEYEENECIQ